MRCPKCGFISFDHLTSCAKCGRDVSQVAAELQGTSIKVETPMFLSEALAAFSESGESFEEHAMEAEVGQDVDFDMEMEAETEEPAEMAGAAEGEVDFSFEDEAPGMAAAEEPAVEATEESFEELDFVEAAEEEEEGGLEFELEDFMEDIDEDEPASSSTEVEADVDIDLGGEKK